MINWLGQTFGRGHSTVGRGLIALIAAPILITVPIGVGLMIDDFHGQGCACVWPSPLSLIRSFRGVAYGLTVFTVLLGGPTWIGLRWIRQERGWLYVVLGLAEALSVGIAYSLSFNGYFRSDLTPTFALAGAIGAATAWAFWIIARQPVAALAANVEPDTPKNSAPSV